MGMRKARCPSCNKRRRYEDLPSEVAKDGVAKKPCEVCLREASRRAILDAPLDPPGGAS